MEGHCEESHRVTDKIEIKNSRPLKEYVQKYRLRKKLRENRQWKRTVQNVDKSAIFLV